MIDIVTTKDDLEVGAGKGEDAPYEHNNLAWVRRDGLVDLIVDKLAAALQRGKRLIFGAPGRIRSQDAFLCGQFCDCLEIP